MVRLFAGHAAELEQVIEVAFAHGLAFLDRVIKHRLGEGGFVGLVVAEATIAVHVDHHVALELLAEIHREPDHRATASGSSPFTWKIGICSILATSVA